jgi:hypothetical protein
VAARVSIPLGIGFYPDWFHKHYGISFNRKYYFDPEIRIETRMEMDKKLFLHFCFYPSAVAPLQYFFSQHFRIAIYPNFILGVELIWTTKSEHCMWQSSWHATCKLEYTS